MIFSQECTRLKKACAGILKYQKCIHTRDKKISVIYDIEQACRPEGNIGNDEGLHFRIQLQSDSRVIPAGCPST